MTIKEQIENIYQGAQYLGENVTDLGNEPLIGYDGLRIRIEPTSEDDYRVTVKTLDGRTIIIEDDMIQVPGEEPVHVSDFEDVHYAPLVQKLSLDVLPAVQELLQPEGKSIEKAIYDAFRH